MGATCEANTPPLYISLMISSRLMATERAWRNSLLLYSLFFTGSFVVKLNMILQKAFGIQSAKAKR